MSVEAMGIETTALPSPARRWYALAILTGVYTSNIADRFVISTLIQPIKHDLNLSDAAIGFLTGTALAIFYTGLGLPLGALADRVDRRKLIAASIAIWSVLTAGCGAAVTFTQLMLARIGVGIGEAGGTPASQSMLADLFPFSQRVMANSIFALGAAAGSMLGASAGAAIAAAYGWRAAFFALAIPGALLAILVRFTVREPQRGALEKVADSATLSQTVRFICSQRALLHVLAAAMVVTYWGWGLLWWTPAFLMRSHHLTLAQAGSVMGTISGIAGAAGIIAGGVLIHALGRRDPRWQVWVVGAATLVGTCVSLGAYSASHTSTVVLLLWMFVPVAYINLAPMFSLTQSLVLPSMRGFACAILLFGANIANLALAPQIIGILSDIFRARAGAGANSLQWALILTTLTGFWAAYHFWAASRHMRHDLARVGVREVR